MKNKFYKVLSVFLAIMMIFSTCSCILSAETTSGDNYVDGVLYPEMTSGTVNGSALNLCVGTHATRLYTANTYLRADVASISVAADCRAYVQFFNADGSYAGGKGWLAPGTHTMAEDLGYETATFFKVTFSCTAGGNDAVTPPADGLSFTLTDSNESKEATYYVSAAGSDENDGTTQETPVATYGKALELAAVSYGVGDKVTIKLMGESVDMGTTLPYVFDLVVEGIESTATKLSSTASSVIFPKGSGITRFRNVEFYSTSQYTSFLFGDSRNIILESTVKGLSSPYKYTGLGTYNDGGAATVINGVDFESSTHIYLLYLGSAGWHQKTFTEDVNVTLNGGGSTSLYFSPSAGCVSTYKKNLNVNLKNVTGVTFTQNSGVIEMDGAIQVINSCGAILNNLNDLVKTVEDGETKTTAPIDTYIINNPTGIKDVLAFTETAGKYAVDSKFDGIFSIYLEDANGNKTYAKDGFITVDPGEYTVGYEKNTGLEKTYYVSSTGSNANPGTEAEPFFSISAVVEAANALGYGEGDIVYAKVLGTVGVPWKDYASPPTLPKHAFKLDVSSATSGATVGALLDGVLTSTQIELNGPTKISNIKIANASSNGYIGFGLYGNDVEFGDGTSYSTYYITYALGVWNSSNTPSSSVYNKPINVLFKASSTRYLYLGNNYGGATFNKDVNVTIDHASANPVLYFGCNNAKSTYNANLNINLKRASGITLSPGNSRAFGANAAVQIINSTGKEVTSSTGVLANITAPKYILTNTTVNKELLSFTETAGKYKVNATDDVCAVVATSVEDASVTYTSEDGYLTVPAGEYTLSIIEHKFTNYTYQLDATCTQDGTKVASCDNGCGKTSSVVAEGTKLGHVYDDNTDTTCNRCEEGRNIGVYYVGSAGSDDNDGLTTETATASIAAAVQKAIDSELYGEGDVVFVKTVGSGNISTTSTIPAHAFKLVVTAADTAVKSKFTGTIELGGETEFDYTTIAGAIYFEGNDATFGDHADLGGSVTGNNVSLGKNEETFTSTKPINFKVAYLTCWGVNFKSGGYYKNTTHNYPVTVEIDRWDAAWKGERDGGFVLYGGGDGVKTTYNAPLNIKVNESNIRMVLRGNSAKAIFNDGFVLQLINSTGKAIVQTGETISRQDGQSTTHTNALDFIDDSKEYIITNNTGDKNLINFTNTVGRYKVDYDPEIYTLLANGEEVNVVDGYVEFGPGETVLTYKVEHTFTNYVADNNATCTTNGTETAKCDCGCELTQTREIADSALGHSFTNYVANGDATCDGHGTETAKCDRCEETNTRDASAGALGHSFTNYVYNNDATCTQDGTQTAKCDRCEVTNTVAVTGTATGHSFTQYEETSAPDCTQTGIETAECDNGCGATDENVLPALGHIFENDDDTLCSVCGQERRFATFYVSATGNDENDGTANTDDKATLTFQGAIQKAIDAGYVAGDIITIKVVGTTAVAWGPYVDKKATIPEHAFKVIATSETSGATVGDNLGGVVYGGDIDFENITVWCSSYPTYTTIAFNDHEINFASNSTIKSLNVANIVIGSNSTYNIVEKPLTYNVFTGIKYFKLTNDYNSKIYNADVTFNLKDTRASASDTPVVYLSAQNGVTTYNANLNINIMDAPAFQFAQGEKVPVFGENAALQIINKAGVAINDPKGIITGPAAGKAYILNNNTGLDLVEFTSTKGVYKVLVNSERYEVSAIPAEGEAIVAVDGYLTVPAGEYELAIKKLPEYKTYTVVAGGEYATVAAAVQAAVDAGYLKGDTITAAVSGEAVDIGSLPAYQFDLIVESADPEVKTTVNGTHLANNEGSTTYYKNVTIGNNSAQWKSALAYSSNLSFDSKVTFSYGYGTAVHFGTGNDGGANKYIAGQNIYYAATNVPYAINLANSSWSGRRYTGDVNVTFDNSKISPSVKLNAYYNEAASGTTQYQKNLNFILRGVKSISFSNTDGASFGTGVQFINSAGVDVTAFSGFSVFPADKTWIINNKTGNLDAITVTETAGKYAVAEGQAVYVYQGYKRVNAQVVDGILDLTSFGAGSYDIKAEEVHVYETYVNDNNATCTTNATETAICECGCGDTDVREIADTALGHSFTNYVYNNDETCTEDGTKTAKCDRCDATNTLTVEGTATGHAYDDADDSTCNNGCGHVRPLPKYEVSTEGTYATVKAAVQQAIDDGFAEGDTVTINVSGASVTFGGDLPAYKFDLIIQSAAQSERTKIIVASGQIIANNEGHTTYYKNVEINNGSTQWTSVQLNSSNTYFDEKTTFDFGYGTYLVFGSGNDGGANKSIAGQDMYIASNMPYAIAYGNHSWSGRTYTEDVNLTVNSPEGTSVILNSYYMGNQSGNVKFKKNVNFILNKTSGFALDQLIGVTFEGGVQIFNHAGITLDAATLGTPAEKTWVLNNSTGNKNIITKTATAGTFALDYDAEEGKVTVTDAEGNKTYAEGDTLTLAAGTYTIGYESSHTYTNYVSNDDATCTENGTETAACDCGCGRTHTREDEDSALGHSFTNYVYNEDATCTVDGTKTAKCDRCDVTETITATGTAIGHNYGEYVETTAPGCTTTGVETATCQNGCGATNTHELPALGHIYDNVEDMICNRCDFERQVGIFFAGAEGNDDNDGMSNTTATLTFGAAVQKAVDSNNYGEGDVVYIKVVGTTAIAFGTVPTHEFKVIVTSETSGATVGNNNGSNLILGGPTEFRNVTVWPATYPNYASVYFNANDVVFGSDSTFKSTNVSYMYIGTPNTDTTVNKPVNVEINTGTEYLFLGNDYHTRTYNKDMTVVFNSTAAKPAIYFSYRQTTKFNANLNLNFKKIGAITFTHQNSTPVFGENAALQIINSTGLAISDNNNILGAIPAYKKFILNNVSGNADLLSYTATAGKFAVNVDLNMYEVIATTADGVSYKAEDGFLTVPYGEYTVDTVKVPLYKTFYAQAGATGENDTYATVADAVQAAIDQGYIRGDVITVKLLGENVENGSMPNYKFELVVEGSTIEVPETETTKRTRLTLTSNVIANNEGNKTTYKNVEIYKSGQWSAFQLSSSNAVFESSVTFNHGYPTLAFGTGNDGGAGKSIAGQSVVYKATGIRTINFGNGSWSGRKYNDDVNLVVDTPDNPQIAFNSYYSSAPSGSTTYNKNVNINYKKATGAEFIYFGGANFNGAIQIINSTSIDITSTAYGLADTTAPKYIITNKTGDKEIIDFTKTTGVYTIAGDKVVRAINMTNGGYVDSADGVIDVSALGEGEYVLAFPTDYSDYVSTETYKEYIVDRTALNGKHALNNVAAKINNGEHINVVYYGGSVTAGAGSDWGDRNSWRGQISTWLEVNAPNSTVTNVNSAIGGTGSFFGNYRLQEAVLDQEPDLLFIEFSINDYYENITETEAARRFESLVHRVRTAYPECDIVMLLTTDVSRVQNLMDSDAIHSQAKGHDGIATAYGIPTLRVGHALADRIKAEDPLWTNALYTEQKTAYEAAVKVGEVKEGDYTNYPQLGKWYEYVTDIVHPNDKGYKVYGGVVTEFMANSLFDINKDVTTVKEHIMPSQIVSEELLDGEYVTYEPNEEMAAASEALGYDSLAVESGDSRIKYYDTYFNIQNTTDKGFAFEFTNATELAAVVHNDAKALNVKVMKKSNSEVVSTMTSKYNGLGVDVVATGLDPAETYIAVLTGSDWIRLHALVTRNAKLATKKEFIEYFDDFNDYLSFEEFTNEWQSNHASYGESCEIVDGKVKLSAMTGIPNRKCITKNKSISSLNQYISVDVTPEDFHYLHGGAGIYARVSDNHKQYYTLSICNYMVRVTKSTGTTNAEGNYVSTTEGLDFTGLNGRMPGTGEVITFSNDHSYRLAMSVVNEGTIAYIRAIVVNITTGDILFDETYKDNDPLTGTGVGFAHSGDSNDSGNGYNGSAYFDNFYFSNYKFRDGDEGDFESDINGDDVYDIRDLVRASEIIAEGVYSADVDKNHDSVMDEADLGAIRKEILLGDYTLGEFNLKGSADAEAEAMRASILSTESDLITEGGETYYTASNGIKEKITGNVWYVSATATNGTGTKADPWSLDQMNDAAAKNKNDTTSTIKSGDAVLFKRGDEFRLVDTMEREKAVSGSKTDTYAYIIAQQGVLYGAYGEGAKPKFNDSAYNYATEKTWAAVEGQDNIWVTYAPEIIIDNGTTKDPGREGVKSTENSATNVLFTKKGKTDVEIGRRRSFTYADDLYTLHANGHFTYDQSTGKLYVYCTDGNPNEVFSSIDVSRGLVGLNLNAHCSGFVIDNLEFQGFGHGAVYGAYGNNEISVTNCEFGYSGGTMLASDNDDTTEGESALRFGNAVGLWCGGSDFKVNYNWIYQTFDSAISPQGNTGISYNGFEVKGNLLEYNNCDIEIFDRGTSKPTQDATWDDCDWSGNIMRFTTLGWGSRQADKIRGIQGVIRGSFVDATLVKVNWTDNIIDSPGMEIAKLNNGTTYTTSGSTTTYTGLFIMGQSFGTDKVSELGGNKYYINSKVRNGKAVFVDYKLDLTGEKTMITSATTANEFYSAVGLFDTSVGSTSAVYYDGKLVNNQ